MIVYKRGSISALVICLVLSAVSLTGLVYDGGRVVSTYVELSDAAQNAARIGAQHVVGIRDGSPRIDASSSKRAMASYLSSQNVQANFDVNGDLASVRVTRTISMSVLGVVGIRERTVTVVRSALLSDR